MDNRIAEKNVEFQRGFIQRIIDRCGPRLPGSDEEKRAAGIIADEFMNVAGNVTVEEFTFAARSCIGAVPAVGAGLMAAGLCFFWHPLASLIMTATLLLFAVPQIILCREWFDPLFPKSTSQNVYSIIDPPGGARYVRSTLILSGHIDSSWYSPMIAEQSGRARYKLALGFISALMLLFFSAVRLLGTGYLGMLPSPMRWTMAVVPLLYPGFYYLYRYLIFDKAMASPGAMDDLSGIATVLGLVKIYRAYRGKRPRNLRIILAAFGAEESGLRGSRSFIRRHRNDILAGDVWVLNVDCAADADHFLCIEGEAWQMVRYDPAFVSMAEDAMKGADLAYRRLILDAGGTSSAEFVKAGIAKAMTVAAQDRTRRSDKYPCRDTLDRIDPRAMGLMNDLCMGIVALVDAKAGEIS